MEVSHRPRSSEIKTTIFGFFFPVRNGDTENKETNNSRVYFVMLIEEILALEY
jgi:hypothetical protein